MQLATTGNTSLDPQIRYGVLEGGKEGGRGLGDWEETKKEGRVRTVRG